MTLGLLGRYVFLSANPSICWPEGSWEERSTEANFNLQHLGPEAHRVVAERNLALPTTIFAAKDAHVRIPQIGNITAAEAGGEEWSRLEMEFVEHGFPGEKKPPSLSMANMGNEAVVEGELELRLRQDAC